VVPVPDPAALAFVAGPPVEPVADLPEVIAEPVAGASWSAVRGGLSDARVDLLRWPDGRVAFLKTGAGDPDDLESAAGQVAAELANLAWLAPHLPVAPVLAHERQPDRVLLLTAPAVGTPATDPDHHQSPDALVRALARGLRRVHELPADGFTGTPGTGARVQRARERVARGMVDQADFEPAYARFPPERLLELLLDAEPDGDEDLVVVHGDPTFANLLLGPGDDGELAVTGYVDLDQAGVADRYLDLAIAARSLATNLSPEALGPFFHEYGIESPALAKVDFYVLLDEFR
jgi:aminoglycoside phosphotransferase